MTILAREIRSRRLDNGNGLSMHLLEAGFEDPGRPCILLLHGFPELAYSWRKLMPLLAGAGYHVVAPDQRGYGRTKGGDARYDGDLDSFHLANLAKDAWGLVAALNHGSVAAVVGHDFGSPVAAWCALLRPEVFRSAVLMSAPFGGAARPDLAAALAALKPPRKHYQAYYATREADGNMRDCPQGIHAFLRAYYHSKSADWAGNTPFALESWSAEELAKLPRYYVMDLAMGMAETVAAMAPSAAQIAACAWLTDAELNVYSEEFSRTGFQGGLQWYRVGADRAGRTIDVPTCFISGASDWGTHQSPGALAAMPSACTRFRGIHLIPGAGHWVQQERPAEVAQRLLEFLESGA
jgi:pimeloyl-ACP methyl ester carboxylesterase